MEALQLPRVWSQQLYFILFYFLYAFLIYSLMRDTIMNELLLHYVSLNSDKCNVRWEWERWREYPPFMLKKNNLWISISHILIYAY